MDSRYKSCEELFQISNNYICNILEQKPIEIEPEFFRNLKEKSALGPFSLFTLISRVLSSKENTEHKRYYEKIVESSFFLQRILHLDPGYQNYIINILNNNDEPLPYKYSAEFSHESLGLNIKFIQNKPIENDPIFLIWAYIDPLNKQFLDLIDRTTHSNVDIVSTYKLIFREKAREPNFNDETYKKFCDFHFKICNTNTYWYTQETFDEAYLRSFKMYTEQNKSLWSSCMDFFQSRNN